VNDATRPYEGNDFEKVMITTRMALNHLALGEWDTARVAIKRSHEREALIAQIREKQVQKAQEEAEKRGEKRSFRELDGYPVQTIDSPQVNALRNSYQSAFSHYLAGFVYEALGEPSLAAAGYRQAIELQPGLPLLDQGLAGLDSRVADRDSGRTELLVVMESGVAPARVSEQFNLPVFSDAGLLVVPMSFPVIRQDAFVARVQTISLDGIGTANVASITSIDLMARRALRDEMPWIMLRAITRATAKAIIQHEARRRDDSGVAAAVAIIGSVLTEKADERSWRMLPAQIAVARASVAPGRHKLAVDSGGTRREFDVNVAGRYALVSIRMLGTETYIAATPPVPEQKARNDMQRVGLR
ncbi:MAG: COG3014 family protein, partial [Burkholderiales bacterium]